MLHAILVTVALLSSPTQCCGGCGFHGVWGRPHCAPTPLPFSIAPPSMNIPSILRIDQYPMALRVGLLIIGPRPLSSVMAATLQANAQSQP
jgi:hypothetical protein